MKATQKEIKTKNKKPQKKVIKKKPEGYTFGRPTKYRRKYCEMLYKFFNVPRTKEILITKTKDNLGWTETKVVANDIPMIKDFAHSIYVDEDTIVNWTKKHKDFLGAYRVAKELQESMIIYLALNNYINIPYAIFLSKNITTLRDKIETDVTSGGKPIKQFSMEDYLNELKGKSENDLQRQAGRKISDTEEV